MMREILLRLGFVSLMLSSTVYGGDECVSTAHREPVHEPLKWQPVGEGRFKRLWFDIYDARLFGRSSQYVGLKPPLKLELGYLRSIPAAQLVEQTAKQWQRLGVDAGLIQQRVQMLKAYWPDVSNGSVLAFIYLAEGQSYFLFNDCALAPLEIDDGFAEDFMKIWLAQPSLDPGFYRALTGANQAN